MVDLVKLYTVSCAYLVHRQSRKCVWVTATKH